jgi:metal-responsive CopG/Arc/MetJ family transcriptional regulator|tara:strand:+ start:215 stop:493 length:279 start_codon:yes stop_codon:yes gene_type:complete
MTKSAKIAISLPESLLRDIERECEARQETRSEFLRHAVEAYLRKEREREMEAQYIRGYLEMPETEEEVEWVQAVGLAALAQEPWEWAEDEST